MASNQEVVGSSPTGREGFETYKKYAAPLPPPLAKKGMGGKARLSHDANVLYTEGVGGSSPSPLKAFRDRQYFGARSGLG